MILMPAVEIGHHRNRRVTDFSLPRQLRFRHVCHADYIAVPDILVEDGGQEKTAALPS